VTKIEFTLPDMLAKRAGEAGLLAPERFEAWLNLQLKGESTTRLAEFLARTDDGEPGLSPEEVAEEVREMRAEKRAAKA
jgi:hypothetical protein